MEWYVFKYDNNYQTVKDYNIFNHGRFRQDLEEILKISDRNDFEKQLSDTLMYYFWCKSEYEVTVYPWPARSAEDFHIKVDIFEQVNMNWQAFIDYVWEHRKEVKL